MDYFGKSLRITYKTNEKKRAHCKKRSQRYVSKSDDNLHESKNSIPFDSVTVFTMGGKTKETKDEEGNE